MLTEPEIYQRLDLQDPWDYAVARVQRNLDPDHVRLLGAEQAMEGCLRGTGRTTRMIVALLSAMSEGRLVALYVLDDPDDVYLARLRVTLREEAAGLGLAPTTETTPSMLGRDYGRHGASIIGTGLGEPVAPELMAETSVVRLGPAAVSQLSPSSQG